MHRRLERLIAVSAAIVALSAQSADPRPDGGTDAQKDHPKTYVVCAGNADGGACVPSAIVACFIDTNSSNPAPTWFFTKTEVRLDLLELTGRLKPGAKQDFEKRREAKFGAWSNPSCGLRGGPGWYLDHINACKQGENGIMPCAIAIGER